MKSLLARSKKQLTRFCLELRCLRHVVTSELAFDGLAALHLLVGLRGPVVLVSAVQVAGASEFATSSVGHRILRSSKYAIQAPASTSQQRAFDEASLLIAQCESLSNIVAPSARETSLNITRRRVGSCTQSFMAPIHPLSD